MFYFNRDKYTYRILLLKIFSFKILILYRETMARRGMRREIFQKFFGAEIAALGSDYAFNLVHLGRVLRYL